MSHIAQLITEQCSKGVEYKMLGEVGEFIRGNGLQKSDLTNDGVSAIHYGQIHTFYGTWAIATKSFVSESLAGKLRKARSGDLVIATTSEDDEAVAKAVAWLGNVDVVVSGDAYIYRHQLEPKYVSYFFQSDQFQDQKKRHITGTKVRRVSGESLAKIRIPVPPLEIQIGIAKVLDTFAKLEAELQAELVARQQQYDHYRSHLLINASQNSQIVPLGQLGRIVTGRTPESSDTSPWGDHLDFVTPSDIKNGMKYVSGSARRLSHKGTESMVKSLIPVGSILVTCIGADMGKTVINQNNCITNQQINALIPTVPVSVDYLFHFLTSKRNALLAQGERGGGTLPIINKSDFAKIEVLLPPLDVQEQVAKTLNTLDTLVNDLSSGLPAEIKARRQQYEYYRDRLLTFKEAV